MSYSKILRNSRGDIGTVRNDAGGQVYNVDKWQRLRRFLILGSEAGSYYTTPAAMTLESANVVIECLRENGLRTVEEIAHVSYDGLGIKNSPAIFALALASSHKYATDYTVHFALNSLGDVCRTATHLFEYLEYIETLKLRGYGRAFKRALAHWYLNNEPKDIAYQVTKYQQRNGWTHRDVLRLSHPKTVDAELNSLFTYITKGIEPENNTTKSGAYISAVEWAKNTDSLETLLALINEFNLPHEVIPTQWLKNPQVWTALLTNMGLTAATRSLARMAQIGMFQIGDEESNVLMSKLTEENIRKSRVHPFQLMLSGHIYGKGFSTTTRKSWYVNRDIVNALSDAFYASFGNVESIDGRILVAIDRSGSMRGSVVAGSGMEGMPAAYAAAAQALILAHSAAKSDFVTFNTDAQQFNINKFWTINDVVANLQIGGGTACSSPIVWAAQNNKVYDAFVILTDNQTWARRESPYSAYLDYRKNYNPACKLIVVAMTTTGYSIGDPDDANVLSCVGFDLGTPQAISMFLKGEV